MTKLLEVKNVVAGYGDGPAILNGASIAVQPGKGATIQLGNSAGGGGLILKLQPNVNATRDGLDLDYNLDLTGGGGPPQ